MKAISIRTCATAMTLALVASAMLPAGARAESSDDVQKGIAAKTLAIGNFQNKAAAVENTIADELPNFSTAQPVELYQDCEEVEMSSALESSVSSADSCFQECTEFCPEDCEDDCGLGIWACSACLVACDLGCAIGCGGVEP